ncbi:MAG: hypothetical protein KBT88_15545 [Gammaproteobacteria bacterium]|nr:hypothetical protein [Gammaproteobacteria bacterium]MBQ0841195.1 hypothetical protein [Gammaproteobacteria bacterium]
MADMSQPLSAKPRQRFRRNKWAIYGLTCALSLILFFAYATSNDTLNDDGINYIYAAHALSEGLPVLAKSYRPEIFFYRQITLLSSLSGLDLYPSAQVLSLFWQALLACGFVAIVRSFDTSRSAQIIALAVFFSIASLNHLRPDIIRGFGFWALQLWAVWAGLNLIKYRAWRFALLWLGLTAVSTLYRAEGIAYLLLIPVFALLNTCFTTKFMLKQGLKIASLVVIGGGIIYLVFLPEIQKSPASTSPLTPLQGFSAADKLHRELATLRLAADNFSQLKNNIGEIMPNKWAQRSVNDLLIGGFIFHLLVTLIKATNAPLLALSLCRANIKRPFFSDPRHKLLAAYLFVGLLIGLFSVYNKYFVSPRYIMLTAILICIPITLVLNRTYLRLTSSQQAGGRFWKYTLLALPLLICIYPLSRQNDEKRYIRDAGEWVKTHLNSAQKIYFNEQKVAFYTADYANDSFKRRDPSLASLLREGYQYAVLYEGKAETRQQPLQQSLKHPPLKTFQNSRGRSVNVYQLPAPAP